VRPALPRLHAITDERIARRADLPEIARELAKGGGSQLAFHARGRALSGREHYDLAARLSDSPTARLFVNDRLDIALAVPTAGVQLGNGSLPVSAARALNPLWWIGRSVFATASHPGRSPLGLAKLQQIVAAAGDLPVIAIGGITAERVREVRSSGAYGVAAIRAFWDDVEPADAARRMREWMS